MPITYGDGSDGTYKTLNTVLNQKPSNPNKGYFDMSNLPQHPQTTNRIRPPSPEQAASDYNYRLGNAQDFVRNRDVSSLLQVQKQGGVYAQAAMQELERVGFTPRIAPSSPASSASPRPNTAPQNNTPTPSTVQPISKSNNPSPQIPIGNRIGNLANRASNLGERIGNNAGRAAGALALGSAIADAARKPSLGKAASTAGGLLMLAPNPYAYAAGLFLVVGGTIAQMFESPENARNVLNPSNNTGDSPISFTGGQSAGALYDVYFDVVVHRTVNGMSAPLDRPNQEVIGLYYEIWGELGTPFIAQPNPTSIGVYLPCKKRNGAAHTVELFLITGIGITGATISNFRVARTDGLPDTGDTSGENGTPPSPVYTPSPNYDGYAPPDYDALKDGLAGLKDAIDQRNLSDSQKDNLKDNLKDAFPQNNNGVTPRAENRTPQPSPNPNTPTTPNRSTGEISRPTPNYVDKDGNPLRSTDINGKPIISKDYVPNRTPTPNTDLGKTPFPDKVPDNQPKTSPSTSPTAQNDRFKEPSDCKFSCSALAECFSDVNVKIFDGCNPDTGAAKTKEITVQALPKNKANVIATFAELLEIRSRECSLVDRVQTTPEYWSTRVGQIPQAVILFKTTTKQENGKPSYYQLQIPHYNGGKNAKPSLPTYQKGEHMAIYECIDGYTASLVHTIYKSE